MPTCIVSAYFKIPSKQSHEWYIPHLVRFFRGIRGTVVFFTTPDVIDDIRKHTKVDHVCIVYMKFEDCHALSSAWGPEFWERQYSRDRERYHSPQLGVIWYEKREFIKKAMDIVDTSLYVWCDAGCVRDEMSEKCLEAFGRRKLFDANDGRIHLQMVEPACDFNFYIHPNVFIGGAVICGNRSAWTSYRSVYDDMLLKYDNHEISGISDQYVTQSCIQKRPELFMLHAEESIINKWFKFLHLL